MAIQITALSRKPETSRERYPVSPFRMFEDFFNDWATRWGQARTEAWRPAVDILEKDGNLVLRVEMPGVEEKDIEIKLEGTVLTVKAERKPADSEGYAYYQSECCFGTFSRSFTLPETVDIDKINANYKNGVLEITLPQKPEVQPRTIKIST